MSMELEILAPDGVVLREHVRGVQAADASGRFGLLPGHECFVTLLTPCVLSWLNNQTGRECFAAADGGVLLLEKDRVWVVTREAVVADQLEKVADAAATMLEARRSEERAARAEFVELQTALLRQLAEVQKPA
jgi:F-type H+-transporting ATPase subunit epsilon